MCQIPSVINTFAKRLGFGGVFLLGGQPTWVCFRTDRQAGCAHCGIVDISGDGMARVLIAKEALLREINQERASLREMRPR